MALLAGLVEKEGDRAYNTYVCVTGEGLVAKFRKAASLYQPSTSRPGMSMWYLTFFGCRCGILICYDNNVIENVRALHPAGC